MQSIEFFLGPSRVLAIFLHIIYLGSMAIIMALKIFIIVKIIILFFLVWDYIQKLRLYAFRNSKQSIIKIWQNTEGNWGLMDKNDHSAIGILKGDTYISFFILILRVQLKTRVQSIIIPRDILTHREYRMLRSRVIDR